MTVRVQRRFDLTYAHHESGSASPICCADVTGVVVTGVTDDVDATTVSVAAVVGFEPQADKDAASTTTLHWIIPTTRRCAL